MKDKIMVRLKGLDCANCAAKIENDILKLRGVNEASVNLMSQTLKLEVDKDSEWHEFEQSIKAIVKKHEPDVLVDFPKEKIHQQEAVADDDFKKELNQKLFRYGTGAALFLAAAFIPMQQKWQTMVYIISYLIFGYDVLLTALKNIAKGRIFDENFLMSISTIGAIAIGELAEAVFVMLFYQIGETFQQLAVARSRHSIKSLMDIRPDFANVQTENGLKVVHPDKVSVGELIVVKPGEKIPLDGVVVEGDAMLDTSALTGESVPRRIISGETALSGSINTNGVIKIKVTKEFGESTAAKIIELVENAVSKKSKTEQFITKFARVYTPIVVFSAAALAFVPPIITGSGDYANWIGRALIFLVISCPCALVLSVPLGFFSGIGEASRKGILVKGSNYIQMLSEVDTVVFDKTGTLTKGVFEVSINKESENFTKEELIKWTVLAETLSNHPIAKSIVSFYENQLNDLQNIQSEFYEEIGGQGIRALFEGNEIYCGNTKLMQKIGIKYEIYTGIGSVVYTAVNGKYAGYIVVSDKIKKDSKKAIENLKALGVKNTVMLTGDNRNTAQKIQTELGIDICYAELLPHQKVERLENIISSGSKVAFVGDGINDAPVLARADVGIAMGGIGSDAAIEAADVVIMNDQLTKIGDGILIARNTNRIVTQNIIFALAVKALVLILGAVGFATMWMAVFADVGVALIAILNALRKKLKD